VLEIPLVRAADRHRADGAAGLGEPDPAHGVAQSHHRPADGPQGPGEVTRDDVAVHLPQRALQAQPALQEALGLLAGRDVVSEAAHVLGLPDHHLRLGGVAEEAQVGRVHVDVETVPADADGISRALEEGGQPGFQIPHGPRRRG